MLGVGELPVTGPGFTGLEDYVAYFVSDLQEIRMLATRRELFPQMVATMCDRMTTLITVSPYYDYSLGGPKRIRYARFYIRNVESVYVERHVRDLMADVELVRDYQCWK